MSKASEFAAEIARRELMRPEHCAVKGADSTTHVVARVTVHGNCELVKAVVTAESALMLRDWLTATFGDSDA